MDEGLLYHYAENEAEDSVLVVGTVEGQCPRDAVLAQIRITPSYRQVVSAFADRTEWDGEASDGHGNAVTLADEERYDADLNLTDRAIGAFLDHLEWFSVGGMGISYYLVADR